MFIHIYIYAAFELRKLQENDKFQNVNESRGDTYICTYIYIYMYWYKSYTSNIYIYCLC